MQPSDPDTSNLSPRKRKPDPEDLDVSEHILHESTEIPDTAEKTKCPCPICACLLFEEDVNSHLDICLNRSTVLEMVREGDKKPSSVEVGKTVLKPFALGRGGQVSKGGQANKGGLVKGKSVKRKR